MNHRGQSAIFPLSEVLPEVAEELLTLLVAEGEHALAQQVASLQIIDRCRCGDDFCAMFYTVLPPKGAWGPGHRNVALVPKRGDMILDVVHDQIVAIEILSRDEVRDKLLALRFPASPEVTRG